MTKHKNKLGILLILLTFISCTNATSKEAPTTPTQTQEQTINQPEKIATPTEISKDNKANNNVADETRKATNKTTELVTKKETKESTNLKTNKQEQKTVEASLIQPSIEVKPKETKQKSVTSTTKGTTEKLNKKPEAKQEEQQQKNNKIIKATKHKKIVKKHIKSATEKEVEKIQKLSTVKNANLSVKVMNLDTNKVLYKHNNNKTLIPASNLKLLTTGMALETLGKDFRFETKLVYSGYIGMDGTLNGNIYIIGGGDPTLGSKYLVAASPKWPSRQDKINQVKFLDKWVEEVKKMGITKINGDIVADPSYYPERTLSTTWEWADLRYDFASPPSGLTFMDNNIRLIIKNDGSSRTGTSSSITPVESKTRITNKVTNGKRKNITVAVVPYSDEIITLGTLGEKTAYYTTIMKDPETTLARMFSERLDQNGVTSKDARLVKKSEEHNNKKIDKSKLIYTNYSPKLSKIISYTNKYSVNLFAEHMKREVERETGKSMKQLWRERINTDGLYIYDGSGLSRYDGVTSDIIVNVLKHMKHNSKEFEAYYNSLGEPGKIGTFQEFEKNTVLVNNLHGKSGTLTGIKAFGGYMHNKDGDLLAFSILLNHHGMSKAAAGKELEKLIETMYQLK